MQKHECQVLQKNDKARRRKLMLILDFLKQTAVCTARPWNGTKMELVHHAVCLFTPQLSPILTAASHWGMARLSWKRWTVTYRNGLHVHQRSQVKSGSSAEHLLI